MKIFNLKNFFWLTSFVAIFSFQIALAQSAIPENLIPLAKELGCQTKEECAKAFDSNFEKGIELAEKHQVYSKKQSDIAKAYKQEVISKLSGLSEKNFEEEIVKIAKELLKKPKLAKSFQLDKDMINAVETIIAEVKNAGVDVDICSQSAETLSREQLVGCLEASKKLAKKTSVQKYIPKGVLEKTNMADMATSLDEALSKGDYHELGKTAEEAGQKCLKPGSESLKSCDEVAQKFFGPEGVKELATARTQTKQAGDFYLKNLENMELITPNGNKIAGKMAIKNACEKAFETKDVKLARSCGDFAVKNGFTGKEEMEESLKLFESMANKNINFDQCRSNPEICEEFIPEEHKQEFEGNKKIYEIMKAEAGFNPIECERGNVDFEIGRKCFEAAQKALPKLKEIAKDYPEIQRMVSEIEFGIKRESDQSQTVGDFQKFFSQQDGPGGCKNEQECFAYCNDSAHGAECISFGAKHEVFQGNEAVERYQKYNDILKNPSPSNYNQTGQYEENRFNQEGQDSGGRTYPYPASDNRGGYGNQSGFGGTGPSPECFVAIQNGDFAKAKEICSTSANPYQYQQQKPPEQMINYQQSSASVNTQPSYSSSYSSYNEKEKCYQNGGFWTGNYCDYQNKSSSSYSSYESANYSSYSSSSSGYTNSCPSDMTNLLGQGCHYMYSDSSGNNIYCNSEMTKSAKAGDSATSEGCASTGNYSSSSYNYIPATDQKEQVWNSYGLKSWIRNDASSTRIESLKQACANVASTGGNIWLPDAGNSQSVDFGMPDEAKCQSWTPNSQSSYSSSSSSAYSSYSSSSYNYQQCDWSTQYLKNSTQTCLPKTNCYNTDNADYNSSECQGVRSYSSGSQSSYSSYSSCTNEMISLLGAGCHFMYNDPSNTAVYCNGEMTKSAKLGETTATNGCQSSGSYSSSSYYSSYPSSAYSSYSSSSYSSEAIYSSTSSYSSYDYSTACSQVGGTWNSSTCVMPNAASSAVYSSPSYDPSVACSQAGGVWNGSACQMPESGSSSSATQNPAAVGWLFIKIFNYFR